MPENLPSHTPSRSFHPSRTVGRYLFAFAVGLATVAASYLGRDFELFHRAPLLVAVGAMWLSFAVGGYFAGVLTYLMSAAASVYWFAKPQYSWHVSDPIDVMRYVVSTLLVVVFGAVVEYFRVDRGRLLRREEALRASEARYRSLLERSSDGILAIDRGYAITYANPRMCEMLGYTREQLEGRDLRSLVAPESLAQQPVRLGVDREVALAPYPRTMIRKDGSRLEVEVTVSLNDQGHSQATIRDVTVLRREQERVREIEAQLQHSQRLEAVGRLAGGIAHDFNNVLTVIMGNAQLLQSEVTAPAEAKRLAEIVTAGERAASLTRQLLAFSRRQPAVVSELELDAVVRGFAPLLRRLASSGITIEIEPNAPGVRVRADRTHLEQILLNLAVNARDAVGAQGSVRISTGVAQDAALEGARGECAVLRVRDDGVGMDAATQAQIFEPFFTTKPEGIGTGLGLATVLDLAQRSGGVVRVQSAPGKGATFEVLLPALSADAPVPAAAPLAPARPRTLLLIEDDDIVRRSVRRLLESAQYRVIEAGSAAEALTLAVGMPERPEALLLDGALPGLRESRLVSTLLARWPATPIVVLAGAGAADDSVRVEEGTARTYVRRPFTSTQLLAAITRVTQIGGQADAAGEREALPRP